MNATLISTMITYEPVSPMLGDIVSPPPVGIVGAGDFCSVLTVWNRDEREQTGLARLCPSSPFRFRPRLWLVTLTDLVTHRGRANISQADTQGSSETTG